ncbi:DUF58 domain-containing protein [Thermococcus sp.]|uniref:DUF58 domain-containing protein n=1 Tax=Thermococcus sp. TaxID=35749 RepID=UPI0026088547|nr:DUF58 domain-containing protein [Thermococcus sp.]
MKKRLVGYLIWAILVGVALLSPGMIVLAAVPLTILAVGTLMDPPGDIRVERSLSREKVRQGEEVEVRVRIRAGRGIGTLVVRDRLPGSVEVVEGSPVGTFFKGRKSLQVEYSYRLRPLRGGAHTLPGSEVIAENPLGTRHFWGIPGEKLRIRVIPGERAGVEMQRPLPRRVLNRWTRSMEFREIRPYLPGDPMKLINWKATARLGEPLVNELEGEVREAVLFILDSRTLMIPGEGVSPYDVGAALVIALARYLLGNDHHVGLYILGAGRFLPPATGRERLRGIVEAMAGAGREVDETLPDVIEKLRGTLTRRTPLVIYVSNILEGTKVETRKGLVTARVLTGRRPILVDVSPDHGDPMIELEKRAILGELMETARVIRLGSKGKEGSS